MLKHEVVDWDGALEDFLRGCEGALKKNTVRYYREQLRMLLRWAASTGVSLQEFDRRQMRHYLAYRASHGGPLGKGVSQTSRRHDVICAKQYFGFCAHEKYIDEDPLFQFQTPKRSKPKANIPRADELAQLLETVDRAWDVKCCPMLKHMGPKVREFFRLRDRAILLVLLQTGARPAEVLALKFCAFEPEHPDGPRLMIPAHQTKDNEDRSVPLQTKTDRAIRSYLRVRGSWWSTKRENLFVSRTGRALDRNAYGKNFRRYRELAGLSGFSMYGLKHYAATALAKVDIWAASEITGVSIETLKARYLHADPKDIREKLERADPAGHALKSSRSLK